MKVLGYLAKDQAMALTLSGLNGMKDQAMALTLTLVKTTEPQTWKNGVKSTVVTQAPTMAPMATMATTVPISTLLNLNLTPHGTHALTRAMEKISRSAW